MPRTSTAREDAIAAAADLFRRQGYAATGLEAILAASGAPKGSFYHHFPGGKEDLVIEAIRLGGQQVTERLEHAARTAQTAGALVTAVAAAQAAELRESGYELGCPVATVALELAGGSDAVADVSRSAFERWAAPLASKLRASGQADAEAARLARWAIANLEGALLLARVSRDDSIINEAAEITARMLDEASARPAGPADGDGGPLAMP
jgi:TetR/AcrR family transcriptional repressor of lmrAB and yxaGH operons